MLALMFPGQGLQRVAMGRPWVDDEAWRIVDVASDLTGTDLGRLLLSAGREELRATRNAQLASVLVGLMAFAAVERAGVAPAFLAGHSVGEYTALAAADALSPPDAITLVAERGRAMEYACAERHGTMAAIYGLGDDSDVHGACDRAEGEVWVANYNAADQTVIAGTHDAVDEATCIAEEMGATGVACLPVAGAFHTPLMGPARRPLRSLLAAADFHASRIPVVANVDARVHESAADWPRLLSAQLCSPVRWRQSLVRLARAGCDTFIELGPGRALGDFVRATLPSARVARVASPEDAELLPARLEELEAAAHRPVGETLHTTERLIVSPANGIFRPSEPGDRITTEGEFVTVGDVVGTVAEEPVQSAFAGWLMGLLVESGDRVKVGQALAWLRAG